MKHIKKSKLVSYSILIIVLLGCIKGKEVVPDPAFNTKCTNASPVRKVLIIGIDGVRTDAMLAAQSPAFDSLMAHGYVSLNCDRGPYTVSGPGWSTILHGVFPAKHGVTSNSFTNANNFTQYPDLFYYMRKYNANFNLTVLCNWDVFLNITSNESYQQSITDPGDANVGDLQIKTKAISLINTCPPDVLLLHLENVDSKGHNSGFSPTNPAYMNAIKQIGVYVDEIMVAVEQREQNNNEEWLVFVVTDHGGVGYYHGDQDTVPQTRYVFEIARLPNMSRINLPSANNTNVMPTVLKYMGVPIDTAWGLDGTPIF